MKDFGELSSKTVTEVLMLEMKMAANALAYIVSGFPRNMRDVVEYTDKIKVVTGVVLVKWRRKVLERQVAYGAKLGHVVLRLARMELRYFYHHTIPVAEYFDQRGMLLAVDGERDPDEVYVDFKRAVNRLLQPVRPFERNPEGIELEEATSYGGSGGIRSNALFNNDSLRRTLAVVETHQPSRSRYPPVIWVLGGPGSNKASLCQRALRKEGNTSTGWIQLSLGRTLRSMAVRSGSNNHNVNKRSSIMLLSSRSPSPTQSASGSNRAIGKRLRQLISSGEMAPTSSVESIIESQMEKGIREGVRGFIIDGFPRDLNQLFSFESKYGQKPQLILLDCSKLQLGRGRLDDSVSAFRRRLQLFRELTLPMLRALDQMNRLIIVDGDTDSPSVQDEFSSHIVKIIAHYSDLKRLHERQGGLANGLPHIHSTKPAPLTSRPSMDIPTESDVAERSENAQTDNSRRGVMRNRVTMNGVGIRGIARAKELSSRERGEGETRIGNGFVRSLQQPAPPPYQDAYAIQDSYM